MSRHNFHRAYLELGMIEQLKNISKQLYLAGMDPNAWQLCLFDDNKSFTKFSVSDDRTFYFVIKKTEIHPLSMRCWCNKLNSTHWLMIQLVITSLVCNKLNQFTTWDINAINSTQLTEAWYIVLHNDTTSQELILNLTFYGTFHIELIYIISQIQRMHMHKTICKQHELFIYFCRETTSAIFRHCLYVLIYCWLICVQYFPHNLADFYYSFTVMELSCMV